jgi:hypothetical protein
MKRSKAPYSIVISLVAIIGYGFGCFLSRNFSSLGNTQESIGVAFLIAISLAGLSFSASFMKQRDGNCLVNRIWEYTSVLVLSALMF